MHSPGKTLNEDTIATLQYMAPECLLKGHYTPSSDVYAFGVLAWELLHDAEAHQGLTEFHLINAIVNQGHCLKFDSSIPADLEEVFTACLSIDLDQRPTAKNICIKFADHLKSRK